MKKLIILSILISLVLSQNSYAQVTQAKKQQATTKSIVNGVVSDAKTGEKLIGALILISGTSNGGISDGKGNFTIKNIDKGKETSIEISYVGYKTEIIKIKPTENTLTLAPIKLKEESIRIDDVTVIGSAPTAEIKGDTTVFNAGAYKTNPDATAGDLLAKMPGFEKNDDGTVSTQGDKVQRIFVDGKSFFKNDLATALGSLPAGLVESIEMFDDKSDKSKFTGYDDGSKVKSINIITKNRMGDKPVSMIEASAGYGYEDVYMGNLNYMRFSEKQQISVMAGTNNINISPISMGRRGFGFGGNGGINTQTGFAVNFSNTLKNDGEIGFSYTFNNSKNDRQSIQTSTYFPTESYDNRSYDSESSSNNKSNRHNFSLDYKTNIGQKTQITFRPSGSISSSDNFSLSKNNSIVDGDTTSNNRQNTSSPFNYSVGGDLSIMRKFTENSFLTLEINADFEKSDNDSYLEGVTKYSFKEEEGVDPKVDEFQHQKSIDASSTNQVSASLDYTQRISRTSGLNFGYEFGYNFSDNDRRTYIFDEETGTYKDLDEDMSNVFKRNYMTNNLGIRYNYKTEMASFNIGAKYQNAQMTNERTFPNPKTKQSPSFDGAVLNAEYTYGKRNSGSNFAVSYHGSPSYPSVTQLQDVLNNDNPLQLSSGNPKLKQSFENSFELRYRLASIKKSIFVGVYSRINNTINGIVNNTILYDQESTITVGGRDYKVDKGAQYSSPTNMDGNWRGGVGGDFSFPLDIIKTKINLRAGYDYSKQPSMYNNEKYSTTSNGVSGNIGFFSNISENIDFGINNRIRYNVSNNTQLKSKTKNTSLTNNLSANLNWIIWKGFFINADYTMTYRKYSTNNLDKPYTNMLNGAIGKKFADDKFEIRASVYDALNQNINISQDINDIYISETISNNLTRYFSISFSYKFNSMKKDMKEFRKSIPEGMPGGGGHGGYRGRRTM